MNQNHDHTISIMDHIANGVGAVTVCAAIYAAMWWPM